ncbi:MAG: hypothetical protein RLZZ507_1928 [Cyanobacteriota bacterium]|jgi:hypothetical protein
MFDKAVDYQIVSLGVSFKKLTAGRFTLNA